MAERGLCALVVAASVLVAAAGGGAVAAGAAERQPLKPLRVLASNPRYFTDGSGRAIYLTGSHTWANLVDMGYPAASFDYERYLDMLVAHNHNFIRLWTWELPRYHFWGRLRYASPPHPWPRTGPGLALDGRPKFDLSQLDPSYFERLRQRVSAAGARRIYVSVMLFEGYTPQFAQRPWNWDAHPFNRANNVNGIDGDPNDDGQGLEVHTLAVPRVTAVQRAYVARVLRAVSDLPNVLFEISNETHGGSTEWQYSMIRFVKKLGAEARRPRPVGMTFQFEGGSNETLLRSPADWISPKGNHFTDPPVPRKKVSLSDSDHHCGICGDRFFVWKNFMRGHNVLFMDHYNGDLWLDDVRRAMGDTRRFAERVDLARMTPRPRLSSTRYVLARPSFEYLVYNPEGGSFTLDLRGAKSRYTATWFDAETRVYKVGAGIRGGRLVTLSPPFEHDVVVHLRRR